MLTSVRKTKCQQYHDLDHLAGTWTVQDAKEFEENIESLQSVDDDLWSNKKKPV